MDNKYYVPDISEFHVGFEFEYRDPNYDGREIFQKAIIKDSSTIDLLVNKTSVDCEHLLEDIYYSLNPSNQIKEENRSPWIRVKHLDKDDIKELGWIDGDMFGMSCYLRKREDGKPDFDAPQLDINSYENHFAVIYGDKDTIFKGTIKNKSELKKIMEQLNIGE